jgi:hypothetical protein
MNYPAASGWCHSFFDHIQQVSKCDKRFIDHILTIIFIGCYALPFKVIKKSPVFVLMTVNAQVLPVAPVAGIVVVIMVPMMYRQEVDILVCKFTAAACAYPPKSAHDSL